MDDEDDEFDIDRSTDATHLRLIVFGRFKDGLMKKTRHPIAVGINCDTGELYSYRCLRNKW